jgi:hypothetical protein
MYTGTVLEKHVNCIVAAILSSYMLEAALLPRFQYTNAFIRSRATAPAPWRMPASVVPGNEPRTT